MLQVIFFAIGFLLAYLVYEHFKRKPMLKHNDKRYILITGCDSGFGNIAAKKLDSMGCHVFAACYTTDGSRSLKEESSSRLKTLPLDISKTTSIKQAYEFVSHELSKAEQIGLWGLVNNAGILWTVNGPLEIMNRGDFEQTAAVNLFGTIDMCLTFLPLLKLSKGRIVNMASVSARSVGSEVVPYSVSKFGVEAFSDGLRSNVEKYGIKVCVIEPGGFKTSLHNDDMIRRVTQTGYDRMSQDVKDTVVTTDYVERFIENYKRNLSMLNENLELVADAYIHGLLSVHPKYRYSVGWDAKLLWIPLSYQPSWIQDKIHWFLLNKLMGLYKGMYR